MVGNIIFLATDTTFKEDVRNCMKTLLQKVKLTLEINI
jgi:hypothetical protein